MVLGFGCVHPPGEVEKDYDGLFFKEGPEMDRLAQELVGKPLCIEHDADKPVGKVVNAWVGMNKALNVIFETDKSFQGFLAENLLVQNVCKDLSLGHDVVVDRRNQRVLQKTPTEVSICAQGDRAGTHVHTIGAEFEFGDSKLTKQYINDRAVSHTSSMSTEPAKEPVPTATPDEATVTDETTPTAPAEQPAAATSADNSFNQELLALVTRQQGEVALLKEKFEAEQQKRKDAENKVEKLGANNKRKRGELIDNTVKKLVAHLLQSEEFKDTLKPQEEQIGNILEGLKDSEDAAPLVDVVACAASALTRSTSKLEQEYQATKRLKTEVDALKTQIKGYQEPALARARARFGVQAGQPPAKAPSKAEWNPVARMPHGMKPVAAPKDGVQVRNPEFWRELVSGSGTATGMGWFDEGNLVGKEYTNGQRPRKLGSVSR